MKQAKAPQQIFVVVPGARDWELWKWCGAEDKCLAQAGSPSALRPPHEATICLPAGDVASGAIWLSTSDESMVSDMAALQTEALFPGTDGGSAKSFRMIRRDEARTLVFAVVTPIEPESLEGISLAARCVPAFAAFAFPANSLTIFRELGALVAVVTTDSQPVGLLRLGAGTLNAAAATEVLCFVMRLSSEGVANPITSAAAWDEPFEDGFRTRLERAGIPCQTSQRASPRIPPVELDLSPARFTLARRRELGLRKLRLAGTAVAAVAAVLALCWLGHYGWLEFEFHRLESANAALHPEADKLRKAEDRWRGIEPAVNPRLFALERLNQFASRLPEKGIRLTLFRMDEKGILITGEADQPAQVVEYQTGLAAAAELAPLKLTMPPPKIMQDNIARFEILGARKGASDAIP